MNTTSPPPKLKSSYRPDIDGIRAIAVFSVIMYHFNIPYFSGGFVGVDIFFVISGFLITKGIASSLHKGSFSFADFYYRRVRRLAPALLVTIAATFICSSFLLSPDDMKSFSGSAFYALFGASNIFFWMQSGYFDSFSSLKPLLHIWSLSVEIQFYLLWPIFIISICKLIDSEKIKALSVILFVALFGYISAEYTYKSSFSAFFLTPFRMHEFAIGGVISFMASPAKKMVSRAVYLSGLSLTLFSIFFFSIDSATFPGYACLLPCIGSAMMIYAGKNTKLSLVTGNTATAHIGEISYSLYLVHWPLFVLTSYALVFTPTIEQTLVMLAGTVIVSYLLYHAVERPLRAPVRPKLSASWFAISCAAFALAIMIPAVNSWKTDGWQWRIPESVRNVNKLDKADTTFYTWREHKVLDAKQGFQNNGKPRLLVIGDSQAADFINALTESGAISDFDILSRKVQMECGAPYVISSELEEFLNVTNKQTANKADLIAKCKSQISRAMDKSIIRQSDKIVIAMYYSPDMISQIKKSIADIRSETGASIYVIGRKNLTKSSIDIVNVFQRFVGIEKYASKMKDGVAISINNSLSDIKGATFVDMLSLVCPTDNECKVLDRNNKPLFFDRTHFTKFGATYFSKQLTAVIHRK